MEPRFTVQDKTGEIVIQFPQSSSIFKKYKIDFCCGGNRPLLEALQEKGLTAEDVLDEINALYAKTASEINRAEKDWMAASYKEIIDMIMNRYHTYLYEHLPEISQYVTKIMRVHGAAHPELVSLHEMFHQLKTGLEQHTIKEEQQIFPLILQYEQEPSAELYARLTAELEELEQEHDGAGNMLRKMREITNDYVCPPGACKTYQLTFKKLAELEEDTHMHVHMENNILFPRVLAEGEK